MESTSGEHGRQPTLTANERCSNQVQLIGLFLMKSFASRKARGEMARAGVETMRTSNTMTADNAMSDAATGLRTGRLRLVGRWIASLFRTAAAYHAAANTYEQLSRLSEAELQRRGLNRTTLARDLCRASERRSER